MTVTAIGAARTDSRVVAAGCLAIALAAGVVVAVSPLAGLGLLGALAFVVLLVVDLPLGVALWVPTLFYEAHPVVNLGAKGAGLLILAVWALRHDTGPAIRLVVRRHARLAVVIAALLVWLSLSLVWATSQRQVLGDLWHWYALVVLLLVCTTALTAEREVRLVLAGFFLGSVASVGRGMFTGGRLAGAAGDPNYLGAWLLAGGIVGLGLLAATPGPWWRTAITAGVAVDAIGLARTLSRGAFVATAVTAVVAAVLLRAHRARILAGAVLSAGSIGIWLASDPAALHRITTNDRGDGRYDLWSVAWRVARDHPIQGVGLNNFTTVEASYVGRVGPLHYLDLVTVHPHVVHNQYLQLMAEVGIVGLTLFVAMAVVLLSHAVVARRLLLDRRWSDMAALATAVLLAVVAMLVAGIFLSSAVDKRLWLLLGLAPALLRTARAEAQR